MQLVAPNIARAESEMNKEKEPGMGACPWYGTECKCDAVLDPSLDPHRGRFAKWMLIDGKIPAHCEVHIPLEIVAAYVVPPAKVSAELAARYQKWHEAGRPRLYGEDDSDEEPLSG